MAEMTPRERVWTAVNHQEPDRVPLDIGGGASTSIVVEGYENLKGRWGVPGETRIMNKIFRVARLEESVMKRLGSDCRPLGIKPPANWTPPPAEPGTFTDMWGITWRQAFYGDNCYYWELARSPLAEASVETLDKPQPQPGDGSHQFWRAMALWNRNQENDRDRARKAYQRGVERMKTEAPGRIEVQKLRQKAADLLELPIPGDA